MVTFEERVHCNDWQGHEGSFWSVGSALFFDLPIGGCSLYGNSLSGTHDFCTLCIFYALIKRFFKLSFKGTASCRKPPLIIPSEQHNTPAAIFFPCFLSKLGFPQVSLQLPWLLQCASHVPSSLWAAGTGLCMCGNPITRGYTLPMCLITCQALGVCWLTPASPQPIPQLHLPAEKTETQGNEVS